MSKIYIDVHSLDALVSTEEEIAGAMELIGIALQRAGNDGAKAFTLLLGALETFARLSDQPALLLDLAIDCMDEELRDPADPADGPQPPEGWQDRVFEAIAAQDAAKKGGSS